MMSFVIMEEEKNGYQETTDEIIIQLIISATNKHQGNKQETMGIQFSS